MSRKKKAPYVSTCRNCGRLLKAEDLGELLDVMKCHGTKCRGVVYGKPRFTTPSRGTK